MPALPSPVGTTAAAPSALNLAEISFANVRLVSRANSATSTSTSASGSSVPMKGFASTEWLGTSANAERDTGSRTAR